MERGDGFLLSQNRMNDFALHPGAAAMDDPDFAETPLDSLIKVFLDHDSDFPRLECVKVNGVFDRNLVHSIQYNRGL